ncbi:MAG: hypothetical protein HFF17_08210 [Oscillospiraceae bacterium]|nr:hypothetical protein [Oscillospiraceae bacterium]
MSASQQKKNRRAEPAQASPKAPQKQPSRAPWILGGIGAVLLLVLAVFFAVWNSGFFVRHATAVTVGSHQLSPAEYNYFYQNVYYNSGAQYMTDTSISLDQQIYDEESGLTWGGYLHQETLRAIATNYAVYDEALANGFTLSQADIDLVEADIANIALSAASSNTSLNGYLAAVYGPGCNEDTFRDYALMMQTVSAYQTHYAENLTYEAAALDAYYAEHAGEIDTVTYRSYSCGEDESLAQELKDSGDEETFAAVAMNAAGSESDSTERYASAKASLPAACRDWLTDPARQYGDTETFEENGSWTAVMFLRDDSQYNERPTVNVRHILIRDGGETTAQAVLDEYLAGEQTEDAFAELARTYTADSNAEEGGLYEGVYPGQMLRPFNDWCFDPARQPGDTDIVTTIYGQHVMYFVGEGSDTCVHARTAEALRSEDYAAWVSGFDGRLTASAQSFGMRFTAGR